MLICFWFDPALGVTPPSQQLEDCSHRMHADVLLLLPTDLILDTKVWEGPRRQNDLASALLQPMC